jgi:hypothetical protein
MTIQITKVFRLLSAVVSVLLVMSGRAGAQGFEVLGTRALGMAGAFVAVADDATAVYWNPAGLGTGPFFDLVLERIQGDTLLDGRGRPLDSSTRGTGFRSTTVALGMPSLGLGYYQIRALSMPAGPAAGPSDDRQDLRSGEVAVSSLLTRHVGATFVQTLGPGVVVGTTVKLVRGTPVSALINAQTGEDALEAGTEQKGRTTTRFDLDAGLLITVGAVRVGVVGRNLKRPEFEATSVDLAPLEPIRLSRQVRAGVAFAPRSRPSGTNGPLTVSADVDIQPVETVFGRRRELAVGAEGWAFGGRAAVRGGLRFNTLTAADRGRDPAYAAGFSVSPKSGLLIEGQITLSRNKLEQGWGVSTRVTF